MTRPTVGLTHDIVLYRDNSIAVGLIVKPFTYGVGHQPSFIPGMSSGDRAGLDTSRWKSLVQQSFLQGAGQYAWSSPSANAAYWESEGVDIAMPHQTAKGVTVRDDPSWSMGENIQPVGHLFPAIMPTQCSAQISAVVYSGGLPFFMFEHSNKPHVLHNKTLMVYTNVAQPDVFVNGAFLNQVYGLTGKWVQVAQTSLNEGVVSAVKFSGGVAMAFKTSIKIWNYNPTYSSTFVFPHTYTPTYSTKADLVFSYDSRLWRAEGGRVAYLQPSYNTVKAQWSNYLDVDDPTIPINNVAEYAGRKYFGKEDSLCVFDAGRTYLIQAYRNDRDPNNFKCFIEHRGALYYNIRDALYRLTSGGMIEQLRTPYFSGTITSGASYGRELHFTVHEYAGRNSTWIFDPETGGTRMWLDLAARAHSSNVAVQVFGQQGHVWFMPVTFSQYGSPGTTNKVPIAAANRFLSSSPRVAHGSVVLSGWDYGILNLDKRHNKLKLGYAGSNSKILVSYTTSLAKVVANLKYIGLGSFSGGDIVLDELLDRNAIISNQWIDTDKVLLLGFSSLPTYLTARVLSDVPDAGDFWMPWVYHSTVVGSKWETIPETMAHRPTGTEVFRGTTWMAGNSGVPMLYGKPETNYPGSAYWIALHVEAITGTQLRFTSLLYDSPSGYSTDWTSLGTLPANGEIDISALAPARRYWFKLDFVGSPGSLTWIESVEAEFMPVGKLYRSYQATIIAADNLELQNMEVEHSSGLITATLFSCAESQDVYTVGFPYPPPTGHTKRVQVSLRAPGGNPPVLAYVNSLGTIESEISVQFNEL